MTIKPYVQYGLGVQKRIKHHFMAFGQAMVQNGGRNGISLTCGFRWAVGCEKCKHRHQKVEVVNNKNKVSQLGETQGPKVILKQMTPQQRIISGGKVYNNSRVASNVNVK